MKIIFTLIAAVALFASVADTHAQSRPIYAEQSLDSSSMPATLATTVVTNLASPPVIDCRKQSTVAVCVMFNQDSASTSNVTWTFHGSVDGTYYDAQRAFVITAPSTGATRVNYLTNLAVGGIGYLKLYAISNATALTTMTNFGVKYGIKIL
jgi:hypothetical protein